jgi:hypothetical protein
VKGIRVTERYNWARISMLSLASFRYPFAFSRLTSFAFPYPEVTYTGMKRWFGSVKCYAACMQTAWSRSGVVANDVSEI